MIGVTINGNKKQVAPNTTVAAAVLNHGDGTTRRSIGGQPRGPLCAMGICFECRLTVDGQAHVLSCQIVCQEGMEIETGA